MASPHRCLDTEGDWVPCPDHLCEADALVADLERVTRERDALASRYRDAPKGGDGSHWDGCHLSHIDCANAKRERAERQRDQAIEALREIGTPTSTGSRTIQSIRRYARDVLANIEKETA